MTRSSEVVMRLNGLDATDGMFDLVFSRPQGATLCLPAMLPCARICQESLLPCTALIATNSA